MNHPSSHTSARFADTKPHLPLLDGLRGVAALMVIIYHVFEGFATSPQDQVCNHGYLAVDFFFVLSGFVIGYAYDDRWHAAPRSGRRLSLRGFFRRRLIRLHPMVVMGTLIGLVAYLAQGGVRWDGSQPGLGSLLLATFLGFLLLPVWPGAPAEVRGNGEMFPLNGPSWSLFFEYIGNVLYALCLRRLSTRGLAVLTAVFGAALAAFALSQGYLGFGWSLTTLNVVGGLLRMLFSYSCGLLLARHFQAASRPTRRSLGATATFALAAFALMLATAMPYAGTATRPWLDGLYDACCVILLFPAVVLLVARHSAVAIVPTRVRKVATFLGDLSYPFYIVHYPFMYLFYAYVGFPGVRVPFSEVWPVALLAVGAGALTAYACLKLYDEPLRRRLSRRGRGSAAS